MKDGTQEEVRVMFRLRTVTSQGYVETILNLAW